MPDWRAFIEILQHPSHEWLLVVQDRSMLLMMALVFNAVALNWERLDILPARWRPLRGEDRFVIFYEQRLNRPGRSTSKLRFRGFMVAFFIMLSGAAVGIALSKLPYLTDLLFLDLIYFKPYGWVTEVAVLGILIGWRQMEDIADWLCDRSHDVSLQEMRGRLGQVAPFRLQDVDQFTIYRVCSELLVWQWAHYLTGIALWYLLLGMPGACFYVATIRLTQLIGYPTTELRAFSGFVRSVYFIIQLFPAIITAFIINISALFVPSSQAVQSFKAWARPMEHSSFTQIPLIIAAYAAGVQLGGKRRTGTIIAEMPWLGEGTPKATDTHLRILWRMYRVGGLLTLLIIGLFYMALERLNIGAV